MPTETDLQCPVCQKHVSSCNCSIQTIRGWAADSGHSIGQKFEAREYIEERSLLWTEWLWENRQWPLIAPRPWQRSNNDQNKKLKEASDGKT